MDEKNLKKLLQGRRSNAVRRGWRCPDEIQLAAYVDLTLQGSARDLVEKHVADCDFCLQQISFLVQAADQEVPAEVPAPALRRARDLAPRKSKSSGNWGWRWAAASAAAACVVLLVAFIALRFRTQPGVNAPNEPLVAQQHQPDIAIPTTAPVISSPGPSPAVQKLKSAEPAVPAVRREAQAQVPMVVFPRNGATLRRSELDFRWAPFPDAVFYDIRVVTAAGDLVLESKTEDTHLRIADDVRLQPRAKYFVLVRAHLRQGNTVKSGIVSFRISER
jgi:hypothetical protein